MEHPGEVWQELDYNGERLGGLDPAGLDEDKVKIFAGATIMLYRYSDDGVEFLFQHRSKFLKGNPDKWDVSAGGHINLNESNIDTIMREAREEIGIKIDKNKLEIAANYLRWKVMTTLYFYDWTRMEDDFHFNDQEVEEVKWVKYADFEDFSSKLKSVLREDKIFRYYLEEWNNKILEKYGDL